MGCGHHPKLLHHLTISLLFLLIPLSTHLRSSAQGRMMVKVKQPTHSQVEVEKTILRGQIGSRPPRCERRCGSCGHCEAIQVPTTPQIKTPTVGVTVEYARGDYSSNYKPMSWKCKCGSFIFNP
ncbi:hypothetical protein L1987_44293 [Smallanthus sonchifolius]|uniref:Uncharacterized protein n=1 Tax=Smallanthus sonchifolius TaxID=185202 RepID=A0ACB9GQC5_9ASTR|nr:hypothetical protein L1987_44293 [Smallanthus sonchifolius]